MGSRGRVTAAFSFSWDSIAQQTREIYYEQRNKHDTPPNWTYSSEGDETLAFALIGPVRPFPTAVIRDWTLLHAPQSFLGVLLVLILILFVSGSFLFSVVVALLAAFWVFSPCHSASHILPLLPCLCVFFCLISSLAYVVSCLLFAFAFLSVAGNV